MIPVIRKPDGTFACGLDDGRKYDDAEFRRNLEEEIRRQRAGEGRGHCPKCGSKLEKRALFSSFVDMCPECDK